MRTVRRRSGYRVRCMNWLERGRRKLAMFSEEAQVALWKTDAKKVEKIKEIHDKRLEFPNFRGLSRRIDRATDVGEGKKWPTAV